VSTLIRWFPDRRGMATGMAIMGFGGGAKAEMVVPAARYAPQAREIGLGLVVGGPVVGPVLFLVVDPTHGIVGWEVYPEESAAHAATVCHKVTLREGVGTTAFVLYCDNGAPMTGATMLATLQRLGVVPSFSRPAVSNANPFSESLFNTLKGRSLSIPLLPHAPGWPSSSPGITTSTTIVP
jgi:hypothetical protein